MFMAVITALISLRRGNQPPIIDDDADSLSPGRGGADVQALVDIAISVLIQDYRSAGGIAGLMRSCRFGGAGRALDA